MGFAVATFIALVATIFTKHDVDVAKGFIDAFILAVTIVVVAIPEGLPLAVAISLAYSTKKMYDEKCFIRQLAACETMGNATNICSDKTGTLTQNRMTVVQGWLAGTFFDEADFLQRTGALPEAVRLPIVENAAVNRTAYYVHNDSPTNTKSLVSKAEPQVVGNKTEASLMTLVTHWGDNVDDVKQHCFDSDVDRLFAFDSIKKRSTAIVHRPDGSVRLYCKGASEVLLKDCSHYLDAGGAEVPMTDKKEAELEEVIENMNKQALRTLVLAHKDFGSELELPSNWQSSPPDNDKLCCDCIVGIVDPIRPDVVEAVKTAQGAGVIVRMVTGDNLVTASAIARKCGILGDDGLCMEGPEFRKLSPSRLDELLPRLRVLARSSPDDKRLLVMRLNGHNLPTSQEEWETMHKYRTPTVTWENDRSQILPGYQEEWAEAHSSGGDVVGVTGDGTNDAPALKAADVGLSMGITGTKVAQEASDIVLLDDRFSTIVTSIRWGRCVYDNIRKFLQFQLTVNIVALILVFVGAVAGFGQPLNAVMMLWVNLIMDTFGALALGTELPHDGLLKRLPYKRDASLVSWPMWRNILVMSAFQLTLLFVLLFQGSQLFGVLPNETCIHFNADTKLGNRWSVSSGKEVTTTANTVTCSSFVKFCPGQTRDCYSQAHTFTNSTFAQSFTFSSLDGFERTCLKACDGYDYTLGTIIFNTFVFCQIFNEYVARKFDEVNMFDGIRSSPMFLFVSIISLLLQIILVELGGEFVRTTPITINQWFITIGLAAITLPVGVLMRFIPVKEDPDSFFDALTHERDVESRVLSTRQLYNTPHNGTGAVTTESDLKRT